MRVLAILLSLVVLAACSSEPETPRPAAFEPLDTLATENDMPTTLCQDVDRCLVAYLAPWCPSCRATLPLLGNVHRAIGQSPQVELIIVISSLRRNWTDYQQMVDALPGNASILLDPKDQAWTSQIKENIPGVPGWIVYDQEGEIMSVMTGGSNQTSDEAVRGLLYDHLSLDSHMQF